MLALHTIGLVIPPYFIDSLQYIRCACLSAALLCIRYAYGVGSRYQGSTLIVLNVREISPPNNPLLSGQFQRFETTLHAFLKFVGDLTPNPH